MPPNTFHQEAVKELNSTPDRPLLPRETGEDVGYASPVPLSAEAVKVIVALRNMKDKDEDWGRWRYFVSLIHSFLCTKGNCRDNVFKGKKPLVPPLPLGSWSSKPSVNAAAIAARKGALDQAAGQETTSTDDPHTESIEGELYCKECYVPLHPDPPPGKLFIFLHALRYTTSHGSFETEMPWWASEQWSGDAWIRY